VKVSV